MKNECDEFIKQLMARKTSRQENAVKNLGPAGQELIGPLNKFYWKIILIVGKCLEEIHHPLAMRLLMGRLDDLLALDHLPGGAITASMEEIQSKCVERAQWEKDEIRRARLPEDDAEDVTTTVQMLTETVIISAKSMPFREVFVSLAREQIKDLMELLGDGPGFSNIIRPMN